MYSVAANYANAILAHIEDIANGNTPSQKITPVGYLRAVAEHNTGFRVIQEGYPKNGHFMNVRIGYQTRGIEQNVSGDDNCDVDVIPEWLEATTDIGMFAKLSIFISDASIARYTAESSQTVQAGTPEAAGMFMREHFDSIIRQANGLFQKVDSDLMAKQALNFGKNVTNGLATAKTVNFVTDMTNVTLGNGMTEIMNDAMENEFEGNPIIVAGGLFNKYQTQQRVKSADQAGINTTGWQPMYEYYYDPKTQSKLGANQFMMFSNGSIILLERNKYAGDFAGDKLVSFNFQMPLPVIESVTGASLKFFTLDAKIRRIDCPTTVLVGYNAEEQTLSEGWQLILSKHYDQFNIPSDAYDGADRLTENNGTLRYLATNV